MAVNRRLPGQVDSDDEDNEDGDGEGDDGTINIPCSFAHQRSWLDMICY